MLLRHSGRLAAESDGRSDVSVMRETMWRQPEDLGRILGDPGPAERAAERIAGRRVLLSGTGTSWHAVNHGAALLRHAGVEAWAVQADESVLHGPGAESRRRAAPAQPPRHEALHERGARAREGGRCRDRPDLGDRGARRRHRDVRARDDRRLHVEPSLRGPARRADRPRARRRPGTSTESPTPSPPSSPTPRSTSRRLRACCSTSAAARTPGPPPRARSRSARPPTWRPRATRWSTCCTARASRSGRGRARRARRRRGGIRAPRRRGRCDRRPRGGRAPLPPRRARRAALGLPAHDHRAAHRARGRRAARDEPRLVRQGSARPRRDLGGDPALAGACRRRATSRCRCRAR